MSHRSPAAKKYDKKKKLKKAKLKKKILKKTVAASGSKGDECDVPDIESTKESDAKSGKLKRSIDYLRCWKKRREEWKFNKKVQIFILRHWLEEESLKDEYFGWFCEYCKGLPTQNSLALSNEAVKLMESSSVSTVIQSRARQLVQSL